MRNILLVVCCWRNMNRCWKCAVAGVHKISTDRFSIWKKPMFRWHNKSQSCCSNNSYTFLNAVLIYEMNKFNDAFMGMSNDFAIFACSVFLPLLQCLFPFENRFHFRCVSNVKNGFRRVQLLGETHEPTKMCVYIVFVYTYTLNC